MTQLTLSCYTISEKKPDNKQIVLIWWSGEPYTGTVVKENVELDWYSVPFDEIDKWCYIS